MPWRRFVDRFMTALCGLALLVALVPLVSLLWLVISRGVAGLSFDFFTGLPAPVGESGGGVGNGIVGTLYIVGIACVYGVPLGVGAGVFLAERGDSRAGAAIRFTAEVLSGVPSIVVGIVAYGLVVVPMRRFSALAGGVALAVLMIPTLARSTEELVRLVPRSLREASLALGVPEWRTSVRVVLRTALGGIMTAVLLSVARAAGETAPLLFTSLNNQYWNFRADQPTASLTVQILTTPSAPTRIGTTRRGLGRWCCYCSSGRSRWWAGCSRATSSARSDDRDRRSSRGVQQEAAHRQDVRGRARRPAREAPHAGRQGGERDRARRARAHRARLRSGGGGGGRGPRGQPPRSGGGRDVPAPAGVASARRQRPAFPHHRAPDRRLPRDYPSSGGEHAPARP